jgi:hypothetical protein
VRWIAANFGFDELDAYMLLTQWDRMQRGKG